MNNKQTDKEFNGATLWARSTINSDLFFYKPAIWFKIWFYIVSRVNFKDVGLFKRGEALITYQEIMTATKASKSQVEKFIKYAKKEEMLSDYKTTRGRVRFVLNYDLYQDIDSYRKTTKKTTEQSERRVGEDSEQVSIVEECNNDKKEKNKPNYQLFLDKYDNLFQSKASSRLTDARKGHINARLKTFTQDEVLMAIENYSLSDFHSGKTGKWKVPSISWVVENDERIEKGLNLNVQRKPWWETDSQWQTAEGRCVIDQGYHLKAQANGLDLDLLKGLPRAEAEVIIGKAIDGEDYNHLIQKQDV